MRIPQAFEWSAIISAFFALSVFTAEPVAAEGSLDPDAWPRTYEVSGIEIAVYMPQILEWSEFRHLKATAAIGVRFPGKEEATYGAVAFEADTVADFDRGTVMVAKREFNNLRFPELNEADAAKAKQALRSVITPYSPLELPIEAVTAAVERSDTTIGDASVSFEAPPIFYSDVPASLVVFIGEPRLEPVLNDDPSLMFVVNTNWDILFEGGKYYLLNGHQWQTATDPLEGPWTLAEEIPESFKTLPDDGNWSELKANLSVSQGNSAPPKVFASDRPAEMIITEGKPQMHPVPGTSIFAIANTESDLFYETETKAYFFLTTGRWFSSASLNGPWVSASDSLPSDFSNLPANHPKSHVLASVKGTSAADEAVIQASIPQTATVERANTKLTVSYDGEPKFKQMPGVSQVQFAVNTTFDVFAVSGKYYCCYQGVWFEAESATGPWVVCDEVPGPVYEIPAESPKYNVTHVHVYESTPESVKVGSTAGYEGTYIANGVAVFGLGMWVGSEIADDDWNRYYLPSPCWYGYGSGAVYHSGTGYYQSGARYYGPYGGAGYGTTYNPSTGAYSRGAYAYGPRGEAGARAAYNPWTNTSAGRAAVSTPYGSWGRSAVVRDDDWVRAGHRSNAYGTVAGVESSNGGAALGVNRTYGSNGFVGESGAGDVYVGKDGNIYKKDTEGAWQHRQDGGWQDAPDVPARPADNASQKRVAPAPRTTTATQTRQTYERPARPESSQAVQRPAQSANRSSYMNRQSTPAQLNRDSYSRGRSHQSSGGGFRGGGGGRRR